MWGEIIIPSQRRIPTKFPHNAIASIDWPYSDWIFVKSFTESHFLSLHLSWRMDRPLWRQKSWHIGVDPNIGPFEENFGPFAIKFLWNRLGNKFSYRLLGTNGQKPTVCDENDKYPIRPNHAVFDGFTKNKCLHPPRRMSSVWYLGTLIICHQSQTISLVISFHISLFVCC